MTSGPSRRLLRAVREDMRVEVRVSLRHPAVDEPLGVEDVEAAVLWDWYVGDRLAGDDEAWLLRQPHTVSAASEPVAVAPGAAAADAGGDGDRVDRVFGLGTVRLLRCDVQYDLCEALDSRSSDAEELASVVFDPQPGAGLSELAQAAVTEPYAPTFLLVDDVAIAPPWRGAQLGLQAMVLLLRHYAAGAGGAALCAMTPGTADADREEVHEGLRRYYAEAGFVPLVERVMVCDFGAMATHRAWERVMAI